LVSEEFYLTFFFVFDATFIERGQSNMTLRRANSETALIKVEDSLGFSLVRAPLYCWLMILLQDKGKVTSDFWGQPCKVMKADQYVAIAASLLTAAVSQCSDI
jgi:hypothetical protein